LLERNAEQGLERGRHPDDLGEVGGQHRDRGGDEQDFRKSGRIALGAMLGEVLTGGDAELGVKVLDDRPDEAAQGEDPEQHVAELASGLQVRRLTARIEVADGNDEASPKNFHQADRS
jgi:hypothetical protein